MGQRQLAEYALEHPELLANEAVGSRFFDTWNSVIQLPSLKVLVPAAVEHMRLLHAVDMFPRGARCCFVRSGVFLPCCPS